MSPHAPDEAETWDLTTEPRLPRQEDVPLRLWRVEERLAALVAARRLERRWARSLTTAIVVAMLGAMATLVIAGGAALVAYGELRERADGTAVQVEAIRGEVRELRREVRAAASTTPE